MKTPYANLNPDIFDIFKLYLTIPEAAKKVLCAGIEGRKKDRVTDLKEARHTINRAIEIASNNAVISIPHINAELINKVHTTYSKVVKNQLQLETGIILLRFCQTNDIQLLFKAVENLDRLLK